VPSIDERLRDQPARTKLIYLLLRGHGPLQRSEPIERAHVSGATVKPVLDEFSRWRDPDDLRRVICDINNEGS
jgi:hypothetical protein